MQRKFSLNNSLPIKKEAPLSDEQWQEITSLINEWEIILNSNVAVDPYFYYKVLGIEDRKTPAETIKTLTKEALNSNLIFWSQDHRNRKPQRDWDPEQIKIADKFIKLLGLARETLTDQQLKNLYDPNNAPSFSAKNPSPATPAATSNTATSQVKPIIRGDINLHYREFADFIYNAKLPFTAYSSSYFDLSLETSLLTHFTKMIDKNTTRVWENDLNLLLTNLRETLESFKPKTPLQTEYKNHMEVALRAMAASTYKDLWVGHQTFVNVQPLFGPHVTTSSRNSVGEVYFFWDIRNNASVCLAYPKVTTYLMNGEAVVSMQIMQVNQLRQNTERLKFKTCLPTYKRETITFNIRSGGALFEAIHLYNTHPTVLRYLLDYKNHPLLFSYGVDENNNTLAHKMALTKLPFDLFKEVLDKTKFDDFESKNNDHLTVYQIAKNLPNIPTNLLLRIASLKNLLEDYCKLTDLDKIKHFAHTFLIPFANTTLTNNKYRLSLDISNLIVEPNKITVDHVAALLSVLEFQFDAYRASSKKILLAGYYTQALAKLTNDVRKTIYDKWLFLHPKKASQHTIYQYCITQECYTYCKANFSQAQKLDVMGYFLENNMLEQFMIVLTDSDLSFGQITEGDMTVPSIIKSIINRANKIKEPLDIEIIKKISRHPRFVLSPDDIDKLIKQDLLTELRLFISAGCVILPKPHNLNEKATLVDGINIIFECIDNKELRQELFDNSVFAKEQFLCGIGNIDTFLKALQTEINHLFVDDAEAKEDLFAKIKNHLDENNLLTTWEPPAKRAKITTSSCVSTSSNLFSRANEVAAPQATTNAFYKLAEIKASYIAKMERCNIDITNLNMQVLRNEPNLINIEDADSTTLACALMAFNIQLARQLMAQGILITAECVRVALLSENSQAVKLVMKQYKR